MSYIQELYKKATPEFRENYDLILKYIQEWMKDNYSLKAHATELIKNKRRGKRK